MNLGVLGGTFDPIHLGHLRAAETAREALALDAVLFVPAGNPPHRSAPSCSRLDRFAMVTLATAGHPGFRVCDLELERDGPSYTVDTLDLVQRAHPGASLVLIVGSDTYLEMASWKDPERLFGSCRVAVVERPGGAVADPAAADSAAVVRVAGAGLPISATLVRALARDGRSLRYLVPDAVADYIEKRGLYR